VRLQDVMTQDLPALSPQDSIRTAAERMTNDCRKALPVCVGERLVGIVTDWDITRAVASGASNVEAAMTTNVVAAPPDATLDEAAELMGDARLHHLCVTEGGTFRGMVHLDVDWAHMGGDIAVHPMATFTAPV
jgi:CBS domain-containing protein